MSDEQRAAFEAWLVEVRPDLSLDEMDEEGMYWGHYLDATVQLAWAAWQKASS